MDYTQSSTDGIIPQFSMDGNISFSIVGNTNEKHKI